MTARRLVIYFSVAALAASLLIACGGGGGGDTGGDPPSERMGITADSDGNTVTIFNADTLAVVGTVAVSGDMPWGVTLSDDGETAYVMNRNSDDISIVSMSQMAETGTIGMGVASPRRGIIGSDGYLYVVFEDDPILAKVMVSGGTPAVVDTVALSGSNGYAGMVESLDGNHLYVGAFSSEYLVKIEVNSFAVADTWSSSTHSIPGYIYDMDIDSNGIIYFGDYDSYEVLTWDTTTDSEGPVIPLGVDEVANGVVEDGGNLYISNGLSYNTSYDGGALSIVDTDLEWNDYDYDQDDDSSYTVSLPFTFTFQGVDYTEAVINSNGSVSFAVTPNWDGYIEYDTDVKDAYGFVAVANDLSSYYGYFNYSHREYSDRVVFQWATAVYDYSDGPEGNTTFEIVLNQDGTVRYDYLFSMPDANDQIGSGPATPYGVGNQSGTALVDLEAAHGSPFQLTRRSFLWDPSVSETAMPEVAFQWEGSGAVHLPVLYNPRDIAITDDYIFLACPHPGYAAKQADNSVTSNVVVVYDRATMLPAGEITVGDGPRGIAIQP